MSKHLNTQGFTAVEVLLALIFVAIVGFAGYYIWHNQNSKPVDKQTATVSQNVNTPAKTLHTPGEASTFAKSTYITYATELTKIQSGPVGGADNPDILQALNAVKDKLDPALYNKLAAATLDISGGGYLKDQVSCKEAGTAKDSLDASAVNASVASTSNGSTIVTVKTVPNDYSAPKVTVDLTNLKITAIDCNTF